MINTYLYRFISTCFGLMSVFGQTSDSPAKWCGCDMQRRGRISDYDSPGECSHFCRSTTLSYHSRHMPKEIRVFSTYDDARHIDLQLCHGNTTNTSKPVILYLTSYDPIPWVIKTNDPQITDNVVIEEIYIEYFRTDKGASTVSFYNETQIIVDDSNTKIKITEGDWNGYGDDSDTNQILYDIKKRYNSEVYSFCGGYSGNTMLCIGEYDIAGHTYPDDDQYTICKIPMDPFARSMLYVAGGFFFWFCVCGSLACIQKKMEARKKRKREQRDALVQERERARVEAQREKRKRQREMYDEEERIREKNRNVYVGNDTHQQDTQTRKKRKQKKDKNIKKSLQLHDDDMLPKYNEVEMEYTKRNERFKDEMVSKQPTESYSAMSCCICLDVLLDHESTKLKCGHKFHIHCIEEYHETNAECPLCRRLIEF